ncbi:hypothetical protein ABK040_003362 [Willaertia magna]
MRTFVSKTLLSQKAFKKQSSFLLFNSFIQHRNINIDAQKIATSIVGGNLSEIQQKVFETVSDIKIENNIVLTSDNKDILLNGPSYGGKTFSYLLPAVELVAKAMEAERWSQRPGFRVLIVVPTVESAMAVKKQLTNVFKVVAKETNQTLNTVEGEEQVSTKEDEGEVEMTSLGSAKLSSGLSYKIVCPGSNFNNEINFLDREEPEIIVATPGRLSYHLKNSDYFRNLKLLVVDDCDQYFGESTFKGNELENVLKSENTRKIFINDTHGKFKEFVRNGDEVIELKQEKTLRRSNIKESLMKTGSILNTAKVLYQILKENRNKKVVVTCPSAQASLYHYLMAENGIFSSLITGKIATPLRINSFNYFNDRTNGIAFVSPLIATALEPNVDLLIQVGAPSVEQYKNTLSRTFSKDNAESIVLLSDKSESEVTKQLQEVPLPTLSDIKTTIGVPHLQQNIIDTLFISKISRSEDKVAAIQPLVQMFTELGLGLPKVSKKVAEMLGIAKELKEANLVY